MSSLLAFLGSIPELISLVKTIIGLLEKGATAITVKKKIQEINKALKNPDRVKAAKELNEVFRN